MQNLSLTGLKVEQGYRSVNLIKNPFFAEDILNPSNILGWAFNNGGSIWTGNTEYSEIHLPPQASVVQTGTNQHLFYQTGSDASSLIYSVSLYYQADDAFSNIEKLTVFILDGSNAVLGSLNFPLDRATLGSLGQYTLQSQTFKFPAGTPIGASFKIKIQSPATTSARVMGISLTPGEIPPVEIYPRAIQDFELNTKEPNIPMSQSPQTHYFWRGDKTWQDLNFNALTNHPTTLSGYGITDSVNISVYNAFLATKGAANGFAGLDSSGKVPTNQLPDSVLGALSYLGSWNAATNTPAIPAAVPANKGSYYKVATSGSTNVSGITNWTVGDWVISNGSSWEKIDASESVTSVAGKTGAVSLVTGDVTESSNLYWTQARFDVSFSGKTTTNLTEGSNLYWTQTRFDVAFSGKTTSNLSEGSNLYWTQARFDSAFSGKTTSNLSEGSNLYFTNSRAISSTLSGFNSTGGGSITSSDSIISALQKVEYRLNHISVPVTSVNGYTGAVNLTTSDVAEGSNQYFTNARAIAACSGAINSEASTRAAADASLQSQINGLSLTWSNINGGHVTSGGIPMNSNTSTNYSLKIVNGVLVQTVIP